MKKVDTQKWSEFWGVTRRTAQRWLNKEGWPIDDPTRMARILMSMPRAKVSPKAWTRAEKILSAGAPVVPPVKPPADVDPEFSEPEDEWLPTEEGAILDLEGALREYGAQLQAAIQSKRQDLIVFWQERFEKLEKLKQQKEAHEKKMGVSDGDILPRADVIRFLRALAFWLNQSVEADVGNLSERMLEISSLEVAADVLTRYYAERRFLAPFSKAVSTSSDVRLPDWAVDELRRAVLAYVAPGGEDEKERFEGYMAKFEGGGE